MKKDNLKAKNKSLKINKEQEQKLKKNIALKTELLKKENYLSFNSPSKNMLINSSSLLVNNEYGNLGEVIIHRPGSEVERLIPNYFKENNFASNMHLDRAQREHDLFVNILKKNNVKVHYIEKLLADALEFAGPFIKDQFIKQFVTEAKIFSTGIYETCLNYFRSFNSTLEMVNAMISGVKHDEVPPIIQKRFSDVIVTDSPFLIKPLPKILYQRNFLMALNGGLAIFKSFKNKINRETIFYEYIIKYHPRFNNLRIYFNRNFDNCKVSGNDILYLNSETIMIGVSKNTDVNGIETLARNLFNDLNNRIRRIVVVFLNYLDLDNLLEGISVVDSDKFIVNEAILETKNIYEILPSKEIDVDGIVNLNFKEINLSFSEVIEASISKKPKFVICGGGDYIRGERERLSYGISALTIAPGEIIVYDRNRHTNQLLSEIGLTINTIPSAELSRGSGGPLNMISVLQRN